MSASTVQPILDSAEQAASSGDYASAESRLREAARLQESILGPQHPDLASTFNNLAVVCEKTNNLADAEEFYERAFSIASASLASEHPLVTTSRNNLDDFRRVHGRPAIDAPSQPERADRPITERSNDATPAFAAATSDATRGSTPTIAGVTAAVLLVGALSIWFVRMSPEPRIAGGNSSQPAQEPISAPPSVPTHDTSVSQPIATDDPPERERPLIDERPPAAVTPTVTDGDARVVEASLCESLSTTGGRWRCAAPSALDAGSTLYFYTRIASPSTTRVHHRWYRNGELRKDVNLAVQANPSAGYRTYSRQRIDGGEWRVEVITIAGQVLREERIAIR